MQSKYALVTGSTGFVGKHLVDRLITEGYCIYCLVRDPSKVKFQHPQVTLIQGDINDSIDELSAKIASPIDVCFHLAGLIGYKKSLRKQMFRVNVEGSKNIVRLCQKLKIPNLVYMSSVAAVGAGFSPDTVLNESSSYNLSELNFGYFDSKHMAEIEVIRLSKELGINAFILNPSTVYGAGDSSKGSRSTQVKVALGKFPFYPPGGVNVVHIDDVIEACLCVTTKGRPFERYIIASENLPIKAVFETIANIAEVNPPKYGLPKFLLLAIGAFGSLLETFGIKNSLSLENARVACMYHWFDNSKAKTELGINFKPSRLAIEASVRSLLTKT